MDEAREENPDSTYFFLRLFLPALPPQNPLRFNNFQTSSPGGCVPNSQISEPKSSCSALDPTWHVSLVTCSTAVPQINLSATARTRDIQKHVLPNGSSYPETMSHVRSSRSGRQGPQRLAPRNRRRKTASTTSLSTWFQGRPRLAAPPRSHRREMDVPSGGIATTPSIQGADLFQRQDSR